jgi:Ser/Thr protein kinase RdoA (MazF antagonist)
MNQRRPLSPAQLNLLKVRRELTIRRRWLWKHQRPLMESIRSKATTKAAQKKQDINLWLGTVVSGWPRIMTPAELDDHLMTLDYHRKGRKKRMTRASLIRRLRSLALIAYNPSGNTWSNLCHLPAV